jgi:asparagine synthase (glutamine-hydrolysing)
MSEPIKTFSVGFRESGEGNELPDARYVAQLFGTEHHELELSFLEDTVDLATLAWFMDEPVADLSALGFLALSELAAQHVTVALSGQGADELFGGYRKHRAASLLGLLGPARKPASMLARALARWSPALDRSASTFAAATSAERLAAMSSSPVYQAKREHLVRAELSALDGAAAFRTVDALTARLKSDPLAETLYLDAQLALVDDMLHYFDRTSMAHSLEVRVPFLDHEFVEFSATIPSNLKVRRLNTHLLKEASRGIVPDRIIDKPKTGFFNAAVGSWFEAQAGRAIDDYLLASEPRYAEFLDTREVGKLVMHHRETRDRDTGNLLLALLMLEVWLSTYLPRFATGRPAAALA